MDRARALLREAGATEPELERVETMDDVVLLAADIASRPRGQPLSDAELAAESETTVELVRRLRATVGLPATADGDTPWFTTDVEWVRLVAVAQSILGEPAVESLLRRVGWSAAQLAYAASAAFRVNVVPGSPDGVPEEIGVIERNLSARPLMDGYVDVVGQLLRHHARFTVRDETRAAGALGELRSMAIGFVDLASSTELGGKVAAEQLATLMAEFESAVFGTAGRHGVRVIKTIGDEAMLAGDDPGDVCRAAIELVAFFVDHADFTSARAGVAHGEVLDQNGDCFGPTVNRAARLVQAAPDGTVMADLALADRLAPDLRLEPHPPQTHHGIGEVEWGQVTAG